MEIGYIVGLNHDTFSMVPDVVDVRKLADGLEIGFGVVEGLHYANCGFLWGLFTGSITYARDARNARHWVRDINGQVHALLGSNKGDGFLAKESQFYPETDTLSKDPRGYASVDYNHITIDPFATDTAGNVINGEVNKRIENMLNKVPLPPPQN